jgi:hypothetical protein
MNGLFIAHRSKPCQTATGRIAKKYQANGAGFYGLTVKTRVF